MGNKDRLGEADLKKPSIVVLGVGNLLMKDEGAGVEAANRLGQAALPDNVKVIDGATAGLDLLSYFSDYDYVIVIDVVRAGGEIGAIYRFGPEDANKSFGAINTSLHEIGIIDVWNMAKIFKDHVAQTTIIAIEPVEIDWGVGLTPQIEAKIPELVELARQEIDRIMSANGTDR